MAQMLEVVQNTGSTFTTNANYAVTISDTSSASDVNIVAGDTNGVVTATIVDGAVTTTLNAIGNVATTDVITFTTTDTSVDASDLVALKLKVDNLNVDTVNEITEVYNTANIGTVVANALNITGNTEKVIITGGTVSVADINTVAGVTSGEVTATVTSAAASVLNALTTTSTDAITMTVNAEASSAATQASDLVSLNGKTNQVITMTAVTKVSGSYADLLNVYVTNAGQYNGEGDEAVTITGTVDSNTSRCNSRCNKWSSNSSEQV